MGGAHRSSETLFVRVGSVAGYWQAALACASWSAQSGEGNGYVGADPGGILLHTDFRHAQAEEALLQREFHTSTH